MTNRRSSEAGVPARPKIKSLSDMSFLDEAPLLTPQDEGRQGMYLDRPVSFMEDGDDPVAPENVPARIRNAVVADYGERFFLEHNWTKRKVRRLEQVMGRPRENITNVVAMICAGAERCPFVDICPYDIIGKIPLGERCPNEMEKAHTLFETNLVALSDRLNVSTDDLRTDTIYSNMVWELVECELVKLRVMASMAKRGELGETVAAIWQETGEVHMEEVESPLIRIYERYSARQDKIRQQLIATPEMAAKFKNKKADQDLHARQLDAIEKLERLVSGMKENIIPAEIVETEQDIQE